MKKKAVIDVKTVSVTYGRKINLGNFENAEILISLWADVEYPEESTEAEQSVMLGDAVTELWGCAKNNVRAQLVPLTKDKQGRPNVLKAEETFLGLPIIDQESEE